jgi:microcystin-dependent protein
MTSMFPLDPSVGDIYNNYEWDGTVWKFIGYEKINDYAPKDSPAITGVASLPSQTTIGVVNRTEIEKLYGFSGQIASIDYVEDRIESTLAGLEGGVVNNNFLGAEVPPGTVSMFAGLAAPFGYLLCDGTAVDRTAYATLFTAISTTYGAGNGTTTFNLPNLKGRVVIGVDAAQAEFNVLGEVGGAKTHQHALANTGDGGGHSHTTADHSHYSDHSHYADHSHYSDHSHGVNPGSTATTSDSHSHGTAATGSTAIQANTGTSGGAPSRNHTHNTNSDSHSHTVNIATFNSGNSNYGNTSNANGSGVTTGTSNYGNTAGANAGNTTSTEPVHSHTISASDTLSNLNPYIALNYIIKT